MAGTSHGRKPPMGKPNHGRKPPAPIPQTGKPADACCPMVAAGRAVRQGRYRLAARYARWSVRLIAARVA